MIAALYVEAAGCYAGMLDVDAYPVDRDARLYAGPHPVVAHPPCQSWSMISKVNHARWGTPIDSDGGCFAAALQSVRQWGGVLEHPAESRAFKAHRIPEPQPGGWQRTLDGDWVTEVRQSAYGHRATKRTWLLYHGKRLPPRLNWARIRGTHQIGRFDETLPQLPKRERAATPDAFRDLLIDMARKARDAA